MAKKREPKTLEELRLALLALIPDSGGWELYAEASRYVVTTARLNNRSVSEFYNGELRWCLPKDRGSILMVHKTGNTLTEVVDKVRHALCLELQERGRKRQLAAAPAARVLPAPAPKLLEYQP